MSTDPPKKKTTPHYSDKTRRKAINMVLNFGHSCDSAGKAVGCNGSTVKRWLIAHFDAKKVIAPQEKAALRGGLKALIAYKQKKLIDILSIRFIDMRKKPSKEKCALIAKHSNKYPVQILCDALNVDRSTFSRYLNPRPNLTAQRLESLIAETKAIHREFRGTLSASRIFQTLRARGFKCSVATVYKICDELQIPRLPPKRANIDQGLRRLVSE